MAIGVWKWKCSLLYLHVNDISVISVYFQGMKKLPDLFQDIKDLRPFSRHQSLETCPQRGLRIRTSRHSKDTITWSFASKMSPINIASSWLLHLFFFKTVLFSNPMCLITLRRELDGVGVFFFYSSQCLCNLTWEMDLPCVELRGLQLLFLMTCSYRRCNLSHLGSAGAPSDFQQLNGPQCSVGFKGFVWVLGSWWATFGRLPAFVWLMFQPTITAREVTALHQHFCPRPLTTSNAFCSCTRLSLFPRSNCTHLGGSISLVPYGEKWNLKSTWKDALKSGQMQWL